MIEARLDAHNPKLRVGLHPPASDANLSLLGSIGNKLPQDFKEAWRTHNGNADMATTLLPPLDAGREMGTWWTQFILTF